jgi:hypothetical protein
MPMLCIINFHGCVLKTTLIAPFLKKEDVHMNE